MSDKHNINSRRVSLHKQPNENTPIGTRVTLYPDFNHFDGEPFHTATRSKVGMIGGSKVVWLEGVSGAYAVDCVEVTEVGA